MLPALCFSAEPIRVCLARGGSRTRPRLRRSPSTFSERLAFGCVVGGADALFGAGGGDVGESDRHGKNQRWRFECCDDGRAVPGLRSVASELDGYTAAETRRRTKAILSEVQGPELSSAGGCSMQS